jgi:hypothetical protein
LDRRIRQTTFQAAFQIYHVWALAGPSAKTNTQLLAQRHSQTELEAAISETFADLLRWEIGMPMAWGLQSWLGDEQGVIRGRFWPEGRPRLLHQ